LSTLVISDDAAVVVQPLDDAAGGTAKSNAAADVSKRPHVCADDAESTGVFANACCMRKLFLNPESFTPQTEHAILKTIAAFMSKIGFAPVSFQIGECTQ